MTTTFRPGTAERVSSLVFPKLTRYADDPNGWAAANGIFLWSGQREINDSVVNNRYTAVRSCHGIGKSYDAAILINWWLSTRPPGDAFVVTTAPTERQVYAILWRYARRLHNALDLPGRVTLDANYYLPVGGKDELVAYGRKPADYDPAAFQGIHQLHVLILLDEAGGVPVSLWEAVDTLATNDHARVLAIGNPDDPESHFERVCRDYTAWNKIKIDAFSSPNFTGEKVPERLKQELVSRTWVEERRRDWGEESPLYISKVTAEFPLDSEDGVVRGSDVAKCLIPREDEEKEPNEFGLDVGAGGDESVLVHRLGRRATVLHRDRNPDTMRTAGQVANLARRCGVRRIKVDSIGIGKGVADRLAELGFDTIPVNVGEKSHNTKEFPRLRDQLWWDIGRELSRQVAWDLSGMPEEFVSQLLSPKYAIDSSGRVKVEPKAETKKRIGHSPDGADALLLAFYDGRPTKRWRLK